MDTRISRHARAKNCLFAVKLSLQLDFIKWYKKYKPQIVFERDQFKCIRSNLMQRMSSGQKLQSLLKLHCQYTNFPRPTHDFRICRHVRFHWKFDCYEVFHENCVKPPSTTCHLHYVSSSAPMLCLGNAIDDLYRRGIFVGQLAPELIFRKGI